MKSKTITFEEVEYEIRSFGFFKANRILLETLLPVFKDVSHTLSGMKKGQQDVKQMTGVILNKLNPESAINIMEQLLGNVYIEGKKAQGEDIDDYELGLELLQESIKLNYSSLGKLIGKLMALMPDEEELPETE